MCQFGRGYHEEQFCEIILNLDKWFRRRCRLKEISYLELWLPPCLVERNFLCNFCRGHYVEHSCEIILNLNQRYKEMSFKEKFMDKGHRPIHNSSP